MSSFSSIRLCSILSAAAFLMLGCAEQTETLSKAPASYLTFIGSAENSTATVDGQVFAITHQNSNDHFEIPPGTHRVTIQKNGTIVVDRMILTSDRQTVEVRVP